MNCTLRLVCFAGLASASASLVYTTPVQAFCRTTTCDPATECVYDRTDCAIVGLPLEWKKGCVSFAVQRDASPKRGVDFEEAREIVTRAFQRWTGVRCDGQAISLVVDDRSPVSCDEPEYNSSHPNANIIMFRDADWPYAGASATLAQTTITFNFETGEIFDADIEVNSHKTRLTTHDSVVEFDLESIITHEAGHFLGLSHSHVPQATMYLEYTQGDRSIRDLEPDDVEGICAAYPPGRDPVSDSCEPRHGFSGRCRPPPDSGCSVKSEPTGSASPAWLLGLLGLALGRRRVRRRPSCH